MSAVMNQDIFGAVGVQSRPLGSVYPRNNLNNSILYIKQQKLRPSTQCTEKIRREPNY
jgi:hypothetical protein